MLLNANKKWRRRYFFTKRCRFRQLQKKREKKIFTRFSRKRGERNVGSKLTLFPYTLYSKAFGVMKLNVDVIFQFLRQFAQYRHQKFVFGGHGGGAQNAILRGQKSKNLPKMTYFDHFSLLTGGGVGAELRRGGGAIGPMPPFHLDPWCRHWIYWRMFPGDVYCHFQNSVDNFEMCTNYTQ